MIEQTKTDHGIKIIANKFEVYFGYKSFQKELWQKLFPNLEFLSLHQVHSDLCVEAKPGIEQKADAHFTYEKNRALVIKTADCVPLFFYCGITDTVLAVHAGWRGLRDEIIRKSIEKTFPYSKFENLQCFIGPHIAKENYEFGKKEILELESVSPKNYFSSENGKNYLDLQAIYLYQLEKIGIKNQNIHLYNEDTFSSDNYYSFRRGHTKDRLYHLIFRKA